MLQKRLATAAIGIPILVLLFILNYYLRHTMGRADNLPLLAMTILIAGASAWEAGGIIKSRLAGVSPWNAAYAAVILPFVVHAMLLPGGNTGPGLLIDSLGSTIAVMLLFLGIWADIERLRGAGVLGSLYMLLWGAYIGLATTALLLIAYTPLHEVGVLFAFAGVFTCDTAAYFGGQQLGGPPMAPKISPKKTFSGASCGLAGAVLLAVLFYYIAPPLHDLGLMNLVWLGAGIGIFGQLGDLLESAFKRWGAVKDSGQIMPGHGGFLDRFDSLFLAAPLIYGLLLVLH